MEPTLLFDQAQNAPTGTPLTRGLRALLVEHRFPYSIEIRVAQSLKRMGLRSRTVRVAGFRVTCRRATLDEQIIKSVLAREEYFRFDPAFRPTPGQTVIDIGANIGTFALVAAKYVGAKGRVISIEPHPENLRYLNRNIRQNNLGDVVMIVPGAISAVAGSIELFVSNVQSGLHSTKLDHGHGSVTVRASTLSEIMQQHRVERCDLLKIDCEGSEFEFLPAIDNETWRRVKRIAMEYTAPIQGWRDGRPLPEHVALKRSMSEKLLQLFQANGFGINGYYDCVGHRAGYIFATNTAVLQN